MAKICVVGPSKKFFSGISACTICLANALSKNNDVSVILFRNLLPRFLYPGKKHLDRQDYLFSFLPELEVFDGMDWNSPLSWLKAYRFLKERRPDVMIISWWTSSVAHMQLFLALANSLKIKAKLILEMHEIVEPLENTMVLFRLYSKIMGRLLMGKADVFIVHLDSMKNQAVKTCGLQENKVHIISHGLFDTLYKECDKEEAKRRFGFQEEFVILYFGTLRRYKGVSFLVDAFGNLPEDIGEHCRLVIVGENWEDESILRGLIGSSPYAEHIMYSPQFVPDPLIPKYFSAADVVVLPYLRASGSAVANIAMIYGKPIIASDIAAMRDCFASYEGTWYAAPGDSTALSGRLVEIYNLCTLGKIKPFEPPQNTWDEIARQYEQLINSLMNFA
jgi:glycosyltransferase involved in cell wall biosynthesis